MSIVVDEPNVEEGHYPYPSCHASVVVVELVSGGKPVFNVGDGLYPSLEIPAVQSNNITKREPQATPSVLMIWLVRFREMIPSSDQKGKILRYTGK